MDKVRTLKACLMGVILSTIMIRPSFEGTQKTMVFVVGIAISLILGAMIFFYRKSPVDTPDENRD